MRKLLRYAASQMSMGIIALFTHEIVNNVDRPTSPNAPHVERFDVRAVYILDRPTSQLERPTFVCKRKRSTFGAAQCQAVV